MPGFLGIKLSACHILADQGPLESGLGQLDLGMAETLLPKTLKTDFSNIKNLQMETKYQRKHTVIIAMV